LTDSTVTAQVDALAVDALARIAQVDALAVDALALVAQVDELAVDALAVAAIPHQLSVYHVPRPVAAAPAAADPAADAPAPPAGDPGVVEVRVAFQPGDKGVPLADEPGVDGVLVGFVHRLVGPMCHGLGVRGYSAKEIADKGVLVVHCLGAAERLWTAQQDRARAEEGINQVTHLAEPSPDFRGDTTLAAKSPGEWRL